MDYKAMYEAIVELQESLSAQIHDAEIGCPDYKVIKVLAATYELQDYLAGQMARTAEFDELD